MSAHQHRVVGSRYTQGGRVTHHSREVVYPPWYPGYIHGENTPTMVPGLHTREAYTHHGTSSGIPGRAYTPLFSLRHTRVGIYTTVLSLSGIPRVYIPLFSASQHTRVYTTVLSLLRTSGRHIYQVISSSRDFREAYIPGYTLS